MCPRGHLCYSRDIPVYKGMCVCVFNSKIRVTKNTHYEVTYSVFQTQGKKHDISDFKLECMCVCACVRACA